MKKNRAKFIVPAVAVCCLAATGVAAVSIGDAQVKAEQVEWSEVTIQTDYVFGDKFSVPEKTVTVDGETVTATAVLGYPDGTLTLKKDNVLDMAGVYTLTYSATVGGKNYSDIKSFSVRNKLASVGSNSSAEYKQYNDTGIYGLQVDLARGEKLELSPIIDLKNATKDDSLIEFFVTPSVIGEYDVQVLYFTLTDADDPNVSLRIQAHRSVEGQPTTYCQAGGQNQSTKGKDVDSGDIATNGYWGTWIYGSFHGNTTSGTADYNSIMKLAYDTEENAVYANDRFVIDLDNSDYWATLWHGFKSGKARLSVSADKYAVATSKASFLLTKVAGVDLSAEYIYDTLAPEIEIQTSYDVAPQAKVGVAYPIPTATAFDDYSGIVDVVQKVYYNYVSDNTTNVNIVNGAFTPQLPGDYAIIYTARDRSGNTTTREVFVRADETTPEIEISLLSDPITACSVGTLLTVPQASVVGGSGNKTIKTEVIFGGSSTEIQGEFRPEKAGTYTVRYTATDYIGQTKTKEYTVEVSPSDTPVFVDIPVFPAYLMSGSEYNIPMYAYRYADSGKQKVDATLTIKDAGNERQSSGTFTPNVASNGDEVTLEYKAGDTVYEKKIKCIIPFVTDPETEMQRLHMENYFVSNDITATALEDGIDIKTIVENGKFTFANKLVAEGFYTNIKALPLNSKLNAFKITLTDSADPSVTDTLTLTPNGNKAVATTKFGAVDVAAGFAEGSASNEFGISFKNGAYTVGVGATLSAGVQKFPSGFVYLTIEAVGASGSEFIVLDINDQPLSEASSDRIRPKIALENGYAINATYGEEVYVPSAVVGDVLDPNCTFYVTVTNPLGEIATSIDGIKLENVDPTRSYSVAAEIYGQYLINYSAFDTFNEREQKLTVAVTVEDVEKPVVKFKTAIKSKISKNDTIVIPDIDITDNASTEFTVYKYVITPSGIAIMLDGDSNSLKPASTGKYAVRIVVTDEAGNMTILQQTVEVTE